MRKTSSLLSTALLALTGALAAVSTANAAPATPAPALPTLNPVRDITVAEFTKNFANPGRDFSTGPLWVWNDRLTEEQIRSTLRDLAAQHIKQAWVHPRPGLMTPYLSPEWFALWKAALDEAQKLDMNIWIYDENSYPSGFAGGFVPDAMPESRGMSLTFAQVDTLPAVGDDIWYVFDGDNKNITDAAKKSGKLAPLPNGKKYLVARSRYAGASGWYAGKWHVDLLKKGVTEKFLDITLDAYKNVPEIQREFGKRVPGIFTDEPHPMALRFNGLSTSLPWNSDFAGEFEKHFGYSLVDNIPSLVQQIGDWKRVRHNYHQLVLELFIDRWVKPYSERCEKYGLELTGHYWEHGWPGTSNGPDNMAMYAWMQRPAIDLLQNTYNDNSPGAQFGNVRSVKELASVANQMGHSRTLSENYGAGGWDMRLEDLKRLGDWSYALGVNTNNEHLSYVTIRGARKRDHPQSLSYHSPLFEGYHKLADHFTRLSYALSQGRQINKILVIEPTTTAWIYQGQSKLGAIGRSFTDFVNSLERNQVEYDLGSERIFRDHGRIDGKQFIVNQASYDLVILPPNFENVNKPTLELLQKYVKNGGRLLVAGELPTRVDGVETNIALNVEKVSPEVAVVYAQNRTAETGISIEVPEGTHSIFHHRQKFADGEVLFISNASQDKVVQVTLHTPELKYFSDIKTSGEIVEHDYEYKLDPIDGKKAFTQIFYLNPSESRLFLFSDKKTNGLRQKFYASEKALLQKYVENGGRLFVAGEPPRRVDGAETSIVLNAKKVTQEEALVIAKKRTTETGISIEVPEGTRSIFHHRRKLADGEVLFISNASQDKVVQVTLHMPELRYFSDIKASGEIIEHDCEYKLDPVNGKKAFTQIFYLNPAESRLFLFSDKKTNGLQQKFYASEKALLQKYVENGGRLLVSGELPTRVDGAGTSIVLNAEKVTPEEALVIAKKRTTETGISIEVPEGTRSIFHHRRKLADGEVLFISNASQDKVVQVTLHMPELRYFSDIKTSGEIFEHDYEYKLDPVDGKKSFTQIFYLSPAESRLFLFSDKKTNGLQQKFHASENVVAGSPMTVRNPKENVLPLDFVDVTAGGETRKDVYTWQANRFAFQKHGFGGNPWDNQVQFRDELIKKKFPAESGFTAEYHFTLRDSVPQNLSIVIERSDLYKITCNGVEIKAAPGAWWLDRAFGKIDISKVAKVGKNTVKIVASPMVIEHEIEPAYLLGDFSLEPAKKGFVVVAPKPLKIKNEKSSVLLHSDELEGVSWLSSGVGLAGSKKDDLSPFVGLALPEKQIVTGVRIGNYNERNLQQRGVKTLEITGLRVNAGKSVELGVEDLPLGNGESVTYLFKEPQKLDAINFRILSNHAGVKYPLAENAKPVDNGFVGLAEVQVLGKDGTVKQVFVTASSQLHTTKHDRRAIHLTDGSGLKVGTVVSTGWNQQGLPFYSGKVAYSRTFTLEKIESQGKYFVKLPDSPSGWYGGTARVWVNGQDAGFVISAPWSVEVSKWLKSGENEVVVEVYGTPKNLLGPHHIGRARGSAWPNMFQRGPNAQPPGASYDTIGYGLFEEFSLQVRHFAPAKP